MKLAIVLSWLPAMLLYFAPLSSAFSFGTGHLNGKQGSAVMAKRLRLPPSESSSSALCQTHQEISDYREGISSARENKRHPEDAVDVVMKFGGSSLADASRVDHVAKLIKGQIEGGYRPRAVVCSAMGKTTNALLSAGDFALGKHNFTVYYTENEY